MSASTRRRTAKGSAGRRASDHKHDVHSVTAMDLPATITYARHKHRLFLDTPSEKPTGVIPQHLGLSALYMTATMSHAAIVADPISNKRPFSRTLSAAESFSKVAIETASASCTRSFSRVDSRGECQLAAAPPHGVLAGLQSVGMKARMGKFAGGSSKLSASSFC